MSALSIANPVPAERRLTGGMPFPLAGLAGPAALATNIVLAATCAAVGASFASALPFAASVSLAVVLTTGSAHVLPVIVPLALRQRRPRPSGPGGAPDSASG